MYKLRIRDAINWLKRHPRQRFSWANLPVCLFGRIVSDMPKFKGKRIEVHMGGKIMECGNATRKEVGQVPFHDAFWEGNCYGTVTTANAIKRLEKLSAAKIAEHKEQATRS